MSTRNIHMRCGMLIVTLMLAAGVGACGDSSSPFSKQEDGLTAEKRLAQLQKGADSGNANAMYGLGWMYANGEGVPKDVAKAVEWWQKAAAQGDAKAQHSLGVAYYKGEGVPRDIAKAVEWWQKAAAQGFANAQSYLGFMYESGEGVPKDVAKAVELYQKAGAQGNADALRKLAWVNAKGEGVPKDAAKAVELYQKAAAQGDAAAQSFLGNLYYNGEGVPKDAAKAAEWYQKAAAQGDAAAQWKLGVMYEQGDGVRKDSVLAYAWFTLSAAQKYYEFSKGLRDSITLSSAQRAEAERLSSNWKPRQVLRRENESASAPGDMIGVDRGLTKIATGTAFVVSREGHAVTNHHVVGGCKEVQVQGRSDFVQVITSDEVSDLALLKIPSETRATAALAPDPASLRQGQDIVVFGFPLESVLSSGGNLTPGVVSAMTGLGNNTNQIQITAPIQPGSSGSPVMNKKGQVVGVVSMKPSDSIMAKHTGTLPQNVNLAISGQTLKAFFDGHRVPYKTGWSILSWEKSLADLGDEARRWTTVVECWK